ncbi:MAG: hypothetical protein DRJ40_09860 [Thermoprotei archaeon]|nr:MAG: hypothetical protein DRJ40_09860 [Thermoprotei archaeon]
MLSSILLILLPGLIAYVVTPRVIKVMKRFGALAPDMHKPGRPLVPEMGGTALLVSLTATVLVAHLLALVGFLDHVFIKKLTLLYLTFVVAACIGLIDDLYVLSPEIKVISTVLACLPILYGGYIGLYTLGRPVLPIVGRLRLTIIYWLLLPFAIAVPANAVNMLDVMNGIMPITCSLAFTSLAISATILGKYDAALVALMLASLLLGYLPYNKYPAKVFNGDVGTIAVGAALGAYAVIFGMEFPTIVTLLPHIMNGFYVITSVKGLKERRKIALRPTVVRDDGVIEANPDPRAPMTLVRLILARGPLCERDIVLSVTVLEVVSCCLAIISSLLMRVHVAG